MRLQPSARPRLRSRLYRPPKWPGNSGLPCSVRPRLLHLGSPPRDLGVGRCPRKPPRKPAGSSHPGFRPNQPTVVAAPGDLVPRVVRQTEPVLRVATVTCQAIPASATMKASGHAHAPARNRRADRTRPPASANAARPDFGTSQAQPLPWTQPRTWPAGLAETNTELDDLRAAACLVHTVVCRAESALCVLQALMAQLLSSLYVSGAVVHPKRLFGPGRWPQLPHGGLPLPREGSLAQGWRNATRKCALTVAQQPIGAVPLTASGDSHDLGRLCAPTDIT